MDPMAVLRVLWRHKMIAAPFVVLTFVAFVVALFFGPRSYEASSTYAMITPQVPSPQEVEANPDLAFESDNPYLRSADPTLALQAARTRLQSAEVTESLQAAGLSTDFTVGTGLATSAQILTITASSATAEVAVATAVQLGKDLQEQIREVQVVAGGSERFLISVQAIDTPTSASERISSRLRNAVVVGMGSLVLLFGAVSLADFVDRRRNPRPTAEEPPPPRPTAAEPPPRPVHADAYAAPRINGRPPHRELAPRNGLRTPVRRENGQLPPVWPPQHPVPNRPSVDPRGPQA
ncbi:hypothetical protein GCM10007304_00380 [Rhodococcoides trifolii]|uniref:Capsular polysaccharide biosynthesis protein n=1 Tax=Rhodococcoides trifolii TaxID=908250 RepID=A0A917CIZ6_9NOCA|nr:chain-length determining protein [Rhodococcus trifolii]GGF90421.1 hypothetical protein GCM10007304_00380 [Rhodococcus trifolii]